MTACPLCTPPGRPATPQLCPQCFSEQAAHERRKGLLRWIMGAADWQRANALYCQQVSVQLDAVRVAAEDAQREHARRQQEEP